MTNCPMCGAENKDTAKFCIKCGATLAAATAERGASPQSAAPIFPECYEFDRS